MPTKRRQPRRRKKSMFTREQVRELMVGHSFPAGFTELHQILRRGGPGWYEACACWQILEAQLLRDWLVKTDDEYGGAGSRPFFWWLNGGHKRLRVDGGGPHPHECPRRNARVAELEALYPHRKGEWTRFYWGLPCVWMPGFDDRNAIYETHTQYIERKGLWLDGEKELYAEQQRLEAERKRREEEAKEKLRLEDMEL